MAGPLFEHRHYQRIAEIIAEIPEEGLQSRDEIANHFAFALRGSNPRFSYDRFEAAARGKATNGRDAGKQSSRGRQPR